MQENFIILTDSALDIPASVRKEHNIVAYKIPLIVDGEDFDYNIDIEDGFEGFYKVVKAGASVKTAAVNQYQYREILEPYMKAGKDVLYVSFSSQISSSTSTYLLTAQELMQEYPERKVLLADTLGMSFGGGLLALEASKLRAEGKSIEEVKAFVESERYKVSTFFTPETLTYLRRGGRLSATEAIIGNFLNLKPIIYVASTGKLKSATKVMGRKKSIATLCNIAEELAVNVKDQDIYILHSSCGEDALYFESLIKEKLSPKSTKIYAVGPIIGAHCGPGTIAVCFKSDKREL